MAANGKYYKGEYIVRMSHGRWGVFAIETVSADSHGYTTGGSNKIVEMLSWASAIQLSYALNGWGFPEFTLRTKTPKDSDYVSVAIECIEEHAFNRDLVRTEYYDADIQKFAEGNYKRFKEILNKINSEAIRSALKSMWITEYNYLSQKSISKEERDQIIEGLRKVAYNKVA